VLLELLLLEFAAVCWLLVSPHLRLVLLTVVLYLLVLVGGHHANQTLCLLVFDALAATYGLVTRDGGGHCRA